MVGRVRFEAFEKRFPIAQKHLMVRSIKFHEEDKNKPTRDNSGHNSSLSSSKIEIDRDITNVMT